MCLAPPASLHLPLIGLCHLQFRCHDLDTFGQDLDDSLLEEWVEYLHIHTQSWSCRKDIASSTRTGITSASEMASGTRMYVSLLPPLARLSSSPQLPSLITTHANSLPDRHNNQMGNPRLHLPLLHRMVLRRLPTRQKPHAQRPSLTRLPPLARPLQRAEEIWPGASESLHVLCSTTWLRAPGATLLRTTA